MAKPEELKKERLKKHEVKVEYDALIEEKSTVKSSVAQGQFGVKLPQSTTAK